MKKILLMLLVLGLVTGCSFNKDEEKNNSNTENNVQENDDNIVDDDNVDEDFQEYVYTTLDMEMYNKLSTPININTTSDLDAKKETIDIDSQTVKDLIQMIIYDSAIGDGPYKDTKVTATNLDDNDILAKALEKVIACEYDENGNVIEKDYDQFTPEDLKSMVIELYGSDIVDDYEVHIIDSAYGGWSYYEYTNTYMPEGGAGGCNRHVDINSLEGIVRVTKDKENIYLYEEHYFLVASFGGTTVYANYNDYIEKILLVENNLILFLIHDLN